MANVSSFQNENRADGASGQKSPNLPIGVDLTEWFALLVSGGAWKGRQGQGGQKSGQCAVEHVISQPRACLHKKSTQEWMQINGINKLMCQNTTTLMKQV